MGITRDLFESCLTQSRETIRRLERERLLEENGYDVDLLNKYANTEMADPLATSIGRLQSSPDNATHRLHSMRDANFATSKLQEPPTSPRSEGGSSVVLGSPLTPPPSLSISGDLSTSELGQDCHYFVQFYSRKKKTPESGFGNFVDLTSSS